MILVKYASMNMAIAPWGKAGDTWTLPDRVWKRPMIVKNVWNL